MGRSLNYPWRRRLEATGSFVEVGGSGFWTKFEKSGANHIAGEGDVFIK